MSEQAIPRQRVAIFGLFGGTNLGNEATLLATIQQVRRRLSGAQVICISPPGSPYASEYGITYTAIDPLPVNRYFWRLGNTRFKSSIVNIARLLTEPWRRRRASAAIRDIDVLLIAGTGVIEDYEQGPLDLPTSVARWTRAAVANGARVAFLSVGAGPVLHQWSRRILRKAVLLAEYRSYRDEYSRQYMSVLNVDASGDPVVPDLAFGLSDTANSGPVTWPPRRIGVGVMGYAGWHKTAQESAAIYATYLAKLFDLLGWLLDSGYAVRMLIGDIPGDAPVLADIRSRFGRSSELEINDIQSVSDLVQEIGPTDLVIATRYHNQLFSLAAGKPVIGLSYSGKGEALMELAGMEAVSQHVEDFDIDKLKVDLTVLAAEREADIRQRMDRVLSARQAVEKQFDTVLSDK